MIIQTIDWQDTLPIRHQVLWPNKPEIFCQIEEDKDALHYGAFFDNELKCVASLYIKTTNDITRVRLRNLATLPVFQNKGVGHSLLRHMMKDLQALYMDFLWCDVKASDAAFFTKLGFSQKGEAFYVFDEKFIKLQIKLS